MTDHRRGGPSGYARPNWDGPPRRVLVLDDDELIVRSVARALRRVGLEVTGTSSAADALEIARSEKPDAVVSDLHMPDTCGAAFLTTIAEILPSAMRVLMSADPEFETKVGSLIGARVHALMSKAELPKLGSILVAQLRGRMESPALAAEREALARSVAHVLGRPAHEDEGHRFRVTRWTVAIATTMGLPPREIEQARLGAILHDVGHVALREDVFTRRGALSPGERVELAAHPTAGARIIEQMPALHDALSIIMAHHERQDGDGYPARLGGAAIPGAARAFQVADAYDAMTRGRPYASKRSHDDALDELTAGAGQHHDADAVRALAGIGEAGLLGALEGRTE